MKQLFKLELKLIQLLEWVNGFGTVVPIALFIASILCMDKSLIVYGSVATTLLTLLVFQRGTSVGSRAMVIYLQSKAKDVASALSVMQGAFKKGKTNREDEGEK